MYALAGFLFQERPMNNGRTIFSQVMDFLPLWQFRKCVARYDGERKVKQFSCLDQLFCMAFAQLSYRESLRDVEVCLRAMRSKLYHMGIRSHIAKSTLADANENRDWRIYADFAQILIAEARELYVHEDLGIKLKEATVYALDSTTIDLCLSLFPWARFRHTKAAIKLHTLLNVRGSIPEFIHISQGKMHDVNVLDLLIPQPGSYYVMDRGYVDFARLYALHQSSAFFVIRAKGGMVFQRITSRRVKKSTGLRSDQTIRLTGVNTTTDYPEPLRRIRFYDADKKKIFVFLTNNFTLPALTVACLYKARWRVELFFKWIKQHLRIKAFYGTSENAVKTQVWIAVSVYVLVAILKKRLGLNQSLYTILQFLSVSLFEKTPILQAFSNIENQPEIDQNDNQLLLFEL
jgi:hypothetical protein